MIGSFPAEQKKRTFIIRVKIELESYDSGKTIDTFPHVGASCGYVNFFEARTVIEHDSLFLTVHSKKKVIPDL